MGMLYHSRYNIAIHACEDEHLLFNAANGAFAALDNNAWKAYETCQDRPCMRAAGFLSELEPTAQLERQRILFDDERSNPDPLELVIAPTYRCNYCCPYCYEQGHNSIVGVMGKDVTDAIERFVCRLYETAPFTKLYVQWYGGDPSLALCSVENISQHLIAFCNKEGIDYKALILSNCNLIDAAAIERLKRCQVTQLFITIDGPEKLHNLRRVAANGSNSFARQIQAARLAIQAGIAVHANMNLDKINCKTYDELALYLHDELGIDLTVSPLCDYGHFFGKAERFSPPAFDLYTHEEFAYVSHDIYKRQGFTTAQLREMLRPVRRFCRGQRDSYFVIDVRGDVYKCDGYMGERRHVMFNLLDDLDAVFAAKDRTAGPDYSYKPRNALYNTPGIETFCGLPHPSPDAVATLDNPLHAITFDATRDRQCSKCTLLPICQGNCIWERRKTEFPCHPFKYTADTYLRDLRECFCVPTKGFTLLCSPIS